MTGFSLKEVRSNHFPFRKWTILGWCPEDPIQVKRKPGYLFHLLYPLFHSRLLRATFEIHLVRSRPYSSTISLPLPFYRGFSCSSVHIQVYPKFDCYVGRCTIFISRSGRFSLHRSGHRIQTLAALASSRKCRAIRDYPIDH
jgi:hypothetical protein